MVAPVFVYVPPVRDPPLTLPPDKLPPEIVAPLIVPRPDRVGEPLPVILPVRVYAPIFEAEIVLTPKVAEVPLSTNVSNVFGTPALSLIVNVALASLAPSVNTGAELDKVRGEALDNVIV